MTVETKKVRQHGRLTQSDILDKAEVLFAREGVARVSLREINKACGISQGVIHYHFGGRDGLIKALLERRFPALTRRRQQLVQSLLIDNPKLAIGDVLEVLGRPLAELSIEGGKAGNRFVQVLVQLHQERNPVYSQIAAQQMGTLGVHLLDQMYKILPHLAKNQVEYRLQMAHSALFIGLTQLHDAPYPWQQGLMDKPLSPEQRMDDLIAMLAAGFETES
ncbi:TetR/AcrR family transcriptional regulator [Ferrimonas pelagia]|uniref:HTH tetR-type domain-containing protein n=1 Tax=Ferrimonas pelagia TaxID=1177826 RepID=A0ABP9ENR6_9GAMM